jgi:hypothetical protein
LDAFALSRKAPTSFIMSFRLSVCHNVSARPQLYGFPWNFMLGTFMKKCEERPNLVKIEQECLEFYTKNPSTFYCCMRNKWPRNRSLRVQGYQAVRIAAEVQTLSECATLLNYSTSCCVTKVHVADWITGWVCMVDWKEYWLKWSLKACVLNYYHPDSRIAGLVRTWRRCQDSRFVTTD